MKKLIAMVMTAAMVASLVPATAFAAGDVSATARIVDALELTKDEAKTTPAINEANYANKVPELQLKITSADYRGTKDGDNKVKVTLDLDNADWIETDEDDFAANLVHLDLVNRDVVTKSAQYVTPAASGDYYIVLPSGGSIPIDQNKVTQAWKAAEVTTGATLEKSNVNALLEYVQKNMADSTGAKIQVKSAGADANIDITVDGLDITYTHSTTTWTGVADVAAANAKLAAAKSITITDGEEQLEFTGIDVKYAGKYTSGQLDTFKVTSVNQVDIFAINNGEPGTPLSLTAADLKTETTGGAPKGDEISWKVTELGDDDVTVEFTGEFAKDDVIIFDLESLLDKTGINRQATVSVSGDLGDFDDMVYVSVLGYGITASTKKLTNVAVEEKEENVKDIVIKTTVGSFNDDQEVELRLSSGFEFADFPVSGTGFDGGSYKDNIATFDVNGSNIDEIKIPAGTVVIEATSAKVGAVATITVRTLTDFNATAKVEVAKVVDYVVELSVDEDEDVPVIYSGVNVNNYGINDDSDHLSLEITAEESFPGAWSMRKGFNFELPEGVYVTDVDVLDADYFYQTSSNTPADEDDWRDALWNAYREGDHKNFEVAKRTFNDVDTSLTKEPASVSFQLELVADPTFAGDVTLKLTGDLVDEQEVVIAKFVKPYEVKAEQNDMKIDYRYTDIPTTIVITEAEAGLWDADKAEFALSVEKENYITFDGDPTFTVDSNSDMKIKDEEAKNGKILFTVDKESAEPATITISDMKLFLDRTVPAGPYDLEIDTTMNAYYRTEVLFAADEDSSTTYQPKASYVAGLNSSWDGDDAYTYGVTSGKNGADRPTTTVAEKDSYIDDVTDYDKTVKEAFVNIVTAGRDQDDATFTTKVVVPVGADEITVGDKTMKLDEIAAGTLPAYINAKGFTMLPVRVVAVALGIDYENVVWSQADQRVTILYGQRVITMQVGDNNIYVNAAPVAAYSGVEIKDGRAYLSLRDLGRALGVNDIAWDASTKTATLNGGNTAE